MPDPSGYLVEIARRCALIYAAFPQTEAIMVTGSAAEGRADYFSDIDMCVYYRELPLVAELTAARLQLGGGDRIWGMGDASAGAFAEAYLLAGVECQIVHATVDGWERDMATVLEQFDTASPLQKALSGMLTCVPLYGEDRILEWKKRAAAYPDRLSQAMVERNLNFFPVWSMPKRFIGRDAALWLHEILVEAEYSLLGVLAGLNRLYFTRFQFKGMDTFIGKMRIAPPDLARRLKDLLSADAEDAIAQLKVLITELTDLVEARMPEIDTSQIRQQLAKRRSEWHIPA